MEHRLTRGSIQPAKMRWWCTASGMHAYGTMYMAINMKPKVPSLQS